MKHIHFIGIGGTGLSAIAKVLIERGESVSGSDRQTSPLFESVRDAGAKVMIGHAAENVAGADLVLRSSAIPDDNVEVVAALKANIPVQKRIDYFPDFLSDNLTIGIAGSHGKTTTSAMITWMLTDLGLAPGFIVGGEVENLKSNASAGKSPTFVIEADEYDYMFWGLRPEIAVVTNLEHDHPDCFPTKEIYYQAFQGYVDRIQDMGLLTACQDDPGANKLLAYAEGKGITTLSYSLEDTDANYYATKIKAVPNFGFSFEAYKGDKKLTEVNLQVPGKHNVKNALAALIVADQLGQNLEAAALALGKFMGAGRRFDVLGEVGGVIVIDDYGHHPTEIKATLEAAKARYPQRRLWALWQPHTFSRTLELLNEFSTAFSDADQVVISKVYASRETQPEDFTPEKLLASIKHANVQYANNHEEASQYLLDHLESQDVLIVFSAGDATEISAQVYKTLQQRDLENNNLISSAQKEYLRKTFGEELMENEPLAKFSSARIGGNADFLIIANSADQLAEIVKALWEEEIPYQILGGGSNLLISDAGVRELVILNKAKKVLFTEENGEAFVWAESGSNIGSIARQAASKGFSGLEWAAGIPGSLGGAIYGNAGAHGTEISDSLKLAEVLQLEKDRKQWSVDQFAFTYRSSSLKKQAQKSVILSGTLSLKRDKKDKIQEKMDDYKQFRRRTQPPGASMGSMFKNPPADFAGRLIEEAGLKGFQIGDAKISDLHANFFVNLGEATADQVYDLISHARKKVKEQFAINLELEIQLFGDWDK